MKPKIDYKTREQVAYMREAGLVVADIHARLAEACQPGVRLVDLDAISEQTIKEHGARSNFKGYYGYPATVCISVNDTVVHGIPDEYRLREGDLVSFDCGAYVERAGEQWHADACFTAIVGGAPAASADVRDLDALTRRAMWAGIAALAKGKRIGDVGEAVEDVIDEATPVLGWQAGIVEEFIGHGIGRSMHEAPDVLNYRAHGRQPKLKPGMVVCVEPILTRGSADVTTLPDGWTVKTRDHSLACHWEHEVAILDDGIAVLTAPDWGASGLAEWGVTAVVLD
ncbi:MAG: type I methionyl aminopeptidase [Actinomycetaceae bacterium]|nr:type I methionyl aminopeptidase [Actinomycetaceae bacterium]